MLMQLLRINSGCAVMQILPKAPPKSEASGVVKALEDKVDQATAPSRSAALSVPEKEEGAKKYKARFLLPARHLVVCDCKLRMQLLAWLL
jgi:hypothetical protein